MSRRKSHNYDKPRPVDLADSLGKLPPQVLDLEEAVLGAVILEKNAILSVADVLKPNHFYDDRHKEIYTSIIDLFKATEPVDMRTVVNQLRKNGKIDLVGGPHYIAELTSKVNSAANIDSHCRIIIEMAIKRTLILLAGSIQQDAYDDTQDVFKLLDRITLDLENVSDGSITNQAEKHVKELAIKSIENLQQRQQGVTTGVLSRFKALDDITHGFQNTDLIILGARPGQGKALSLNEEILTEGLWWIKMKDVKVGMKVASSDGNFYPITGVYPQGVRDVYDVHFDDGTIVRCDTQHLWKVQSRSDRQSNRPSRVIPLYEMLTYRVRLANNRKNWSLDYCDPIQYKENAHYIHPYIIGVLIGDGCLVNKTVFTNPEEDIVSKVAKLLPNGYIVKSNGINRNIRRENRTGSSTSLVKNELRRLELIGKHSYEKHIPIEYLMDSVENRMALLQGLMDTDGSVNGPSSFLEYITTSKQLSEDICDLVRSLGGKAVIKIKDTHYLKDGIRYPCRTAYKLIICFDNHITPVSSEKHLKRYKANKQFFKKFITEIKYVGTDETQCITVDSPDHTFLTNNYTVTHNSALTGCICYNIAKNGDPVGMFSLEMPGIQVVDRTAIGLSEIDPDKIKSGNINPLEMTRWVHFNGQISNLSWYIDDTAGLGIIELRARARRMKVKYGIKLLVVDYIQLINGRIHDDLNRDQEISIITRTLKQIAKELEIPVIAISSLNRSVETRGGDKRPNLSDLRDSGSIESDADVVMFLYRPEYYKITVDEDGLPTHGKAEVIFAKHRNGSLGTAILKFIGKFTKFVDWTDEYSSYSGTSGTITRNYKDPTESSRDNPYGAGARFHEDDSSTPF